MSKRVLVGMLMLGLCACGQQRNKSIDVMNQGVSAFNNKLYDSAEKKFEEAIRIDPTNDHAHQNMGKLYQETKKWDKAADAFNEALKYDPSNAQLHYDLGWSLAEAKKTDMAEKELRKAVELNASLFKAHFRLGEILRTAEKWKEADAAYRKSIEINPRFSMAYVQMGFMYLLFDGEDLAKPAQQVFENAVVANEGDGEAWYGLGLALAQQNEHDKAIEAFRKAVTNKAPNPELKYNLAQSLAAKGDKAGAKRELSEFIQLHGAKAGADLVKAANDLSYALDAQ